MSIRCSTDGTSAVLHLHQTLELARLAFHSPKLLNVIDLVQATSTLVLTPGQGGELVHRLAFPATVARRHAIQDSLVLDAVYPDTDQMHADSCKWLTCPSRNFAD